MIFMDRLFVDTWGWLTLRDKSERGHEKALAIFQTFREPAGRIYTSDFVLDETFTLLFRRLPFPLARESMELLSNSVDESSIILIPVNGTRFKAAQKLRVRFHDKPNISFTDLTSIAILEEFQIEKILSEDNHFAQVGLPLELCC